MGWLKRLQHGPEKLQHMLLWAGWAVAAMLLGRFAIDFWREMPAWLAAPFVALVVAALGIVAMNLWLARRPREAEVGKFEAALLAASAPLGFLASTLDCMGLSAAGCAPFCTFVKWVWIPALAAVAAVYVITRRRGWLLVVAAMGGVPLAPHCICYNVGNGFWIDRLGASPTCYAWGFAVALIAVTALQARRPWPSLLVAGAIIGGGMAFFVTHHFFHYPW